jgi:hypothetical protein
VARALIVGCGCRGRLLGEGLLARGWQVRGTSRTQTGAAEIEAAGIEAAVADPNAVATVLDQIENVTLVYWLLGSARGSLAEVGPLHGARLERVLEELVDTPVRGIVYEAAGSVAAAALAAGSRAVEAAAGRWRIPVEVVASPPADTERWSADMLAAAGRVLRL